MDTFTLVDAGVAVVIIVSGILAYSRGFVRETLAIIGWIVAAILAFMLAPPRSRWSAKSPMSAISLAIAAN